MIRVQYNLVKEGQSPFQKIKSHGNNVFVVFLGLELSSYKQKILVKK